MSALQWSKTHTATAAAGAIDTAAPTDTGTPGAGVVMVDDPCYATKATEKCQVKSSMKSRTPLADDSNSAPSKASQTTAMGSVRT